jgi:hypothetical protein
MFILRQVTEKKMVSNTIIGDNYKVIYREENPEAFREIYKQVFGKDHVADIDETADETSKNCFAFLYSDGEFVYSECWHALFKSESYWIMTDGGKTFDNLTYR